jgi:flagellar protein FlbT
MALVIDLKPGEKVLIGTAVITNGDQRSRLHIEGEACILRERDVMKEEEANSPCKRIYFVVQCMYMATDPKIYFPRYFSMIKEVQDAAPSTTPLIFQINEKIMDGSYYKALKEARDLITYEQELIARVQAS